MRIRLNWIVWMGIGLAPVAATAQGTAITYQGQLKNSGAPVNGTTNFTFKLFDALAAGTQQGSTLTQNGVSVTNGLFTTQLDFGVGPWTANQPRWLEITANGQLLSPRQPLTPAPFALNTRGVSVDAGGNIGIGTIAPHHRLALLGGPAWTSFSWVGSLELGNASAIGWQANTGGNRFGIGQTNGGLFFFRTTSDPGTTGSPPIYDLALSDAGNFGIGVTNPVSRLEIAGQDAITITGFQPVITLRDSNNSNRRIRFQNVDGNFINFFTEPSFGTGIPPFKIRNDGVDIVGQNALVATGFQPLFTLSDSNAGFAQTRIQNAGGQFVFWTQAGLNSGIPPMRVLNSGITEVRKLQILGGADLAEPFDMGDAAIEPGMVVVIDPAHPGQLKPCASPYDRKVAGIVSGAGGVATGLSMGHDGTIASGKHPVALTGRVYCLVDANSEDIEAGDMLTTSAHVGHAMKASDLDRARGSIIGKAMTTLKRGESGLVLVLVNLQ